MPGKTRVSALAKELGITSKDAMQLLAGIGEFVKSPSSTIETPAAEALRRRYGGSTRPARTTRPQTADRTPAHRVRVSNNPFAVSGAVPARPMDPLTGAVSVERRRRQWYRGDDVSQFDRIVLQRIIVPRRDADVRPPRPPCLYFADEVAEARGITSRWAPLLLTGMSFDEILDWRGRLDEYETSYFTASYADAPDDAIELHAAGITPHDLRWRPEDEGPWGTLSQRLRKRTMSIAEVVTEVDYRRAEDATKG